MEVEQHEDIIRKVSEECGTNSEVSGTDERKNY